MLRIPTRALWRWGPPPPWPAPTAAAEGEKRREGWQKEGDQPAGGALGSATEIGILTYLDRWKKKKYSNIAKINMKYIYI
jgi:hypothetical protein